jgi:hypothetical protein
MRPLRTKPRAGLGGADDRLLRGYGPTIALVMLFLVMVLVAPSIAPEQVTATNATGRADAGSGPTADTPGAALGTADPSGPTSGGSNALGAPSAAAGLGSAGVSACAGSQIANDPYSPPCARWAGGNNGGATSPGVDAKTIRVTYRDAGLPDIGSLIAQFSGVHGYESTQADLQRTVKVLIDWANAHYQFYGRKLTFVPFKGQGSMLNEFLSGGQDGATADAIDAAQQQHAFVNGGTLSQPYADALVANKVIALDNAFMEQGWATRSGPYAWNAYPDCTKAAQAVAEFSVKQLIAKPAAFAGGSTKGKPRKFGMITTDSPAVKPCADLVAAAFSKAGTSLDVRSVAPDLNSIQTSAQQVASILQNDGVTTVLLLTDPATPFFYSSAAKASGWFPEWILAGQPFLDADNLAQILPAEEWAHAFGPSFSGQLLPIRATAAYSAYKEQSPDTEPSILLLPAAFNEIRLLAIGVQMAGPTLTPDSFAKGLAGFRSGLGPDGQWAFVGGSHSAPATYRIVWFDGKATSPINNRPGAYRDNGQRYALGQLPTGDPQVFPGGTP